MRAYASDLRQKVVAAVERGDSTIEEAATSFGVGQTFVKKMLRRHRETGDRRPAPTAQYWRPRGSPRHEGRGCCGWRRTRPTSAPIEQCWSKIKTLLRAAKAHAREELEQA
jgi:transposase-like protein